MTHIPRLATDKEIIRDAIIRWLLIGALPGLPVMGLGWHWLGDGWTFNATVAMGFLMFVLGGAWAGAWLLTFIKATHDYLQG